jgi:hypothetical protein
MRGSDARTGELFSYVDLEDRVPRSIRLRASGRLCPESPLPPSLRGRGSGPPGYARCPGAMRHGRDIADWTSDIAGLFEVTCRLDGRSCGGLRYSTPWDVSSGAGFTAPAHRSLISRGPGGSGACRIMLTGAKAAWSIVARSLPIPTA